MGGIAFRAPVLATLFLIVALATLAMPGSSNFVGEFLILLGVFKSKLVIAVIAFAASSARPSTRCGCSSPRCTTASAPHVDSREIEWREAVGVVPLVAVILVLAFYPQFVLKRSEPTVTQASGRRRPPGPSRIGASDELATTVTATTRTHLHGPHIDWAALSPFVVLAAGALLVLLVGLLRGALIRERVVPRAGADHARRARSALRDLALPRSHAPDRLRRAGDRRPGADPRPDLLRVGARGRAALAGAGPAPGGRPRRVPLAAAVQRARDGDPRLRRRTRSRCSSGSSCCRSRCTCCARPSSAARARSSRASSTW